MKLYTLILISAIGILALGISLHGASRFTDNEIEDILKENKELRSELQKEAKAAMEARNNAKSLFQELMRYR